MRDPTHFRRELAAIAAPADRAIRTDRDRSSRAAALPRALELMVLVPGLYLVLCLVFRSLGVEFGASQASRSRA